MDRAGIGDLARTIGLATWADALAREALPSVRLESLSDLTSAATRLGGLPSAPPDWSWPRSDGGPMAHIGQLAMAELPSEVRQDMGAPSTGLLSFFYDAINQPWGFDPADAGAWNVAWFNADQPLIVHPFPYDLDPTVRFPASVGRPMIEWTIPDPFSVSARRLGLPFTDGVPVLRDDIAVRYRELAARLIQPGPRHRVGGHPDQLQLVDPRVQAELVSTGTYLGAGVEPSAQARGEANAEQWRLLLQIDSDERLGTMWGDAGRIFFLTPRAEALAGSLRTWLVLEC
jgi:uncharacterized protein YwqG